MSKLDDIVRAIARDFDMADPILIEPEDLNLYATHKVAEAEAAMRAKIKGLVPAIVETPELPSDFDLSKMEHMQAVINKSVREGANETVRAFTANLIATGLMDDSNTQSQLTSKEQ